MPRCRSPPGQPASPPLCLGTQAPSYTAAPAADAHPAKGSANISRQCKPVQVRVFVSITGTLHSWLLLLTHLRLEEQRSRCQLECPASMPKAQQASCCQSRLTAPARAARRSGAGAAALQTALEHGCAANVQGRVVSRRAASGKTSVTSQQAWRSHMAAVASILCSCV